MSDSHRQLRDMERRLGQTEVRESAGGGGAAFPASPPTGFRFWRTDLGFLCYYDGTRWLTAHEYVLPLVYLATISANTDSANIPIPGALSFSGVYITRATFITRVITTNDGSNYWSFQAQGINTANSAASVLYSPTTAADTVATYTAHEGLDGGASVPANKTWYRTNASKVGAPGNLTYAVALNYRLIVP